MKLGGTTLGHRMVGGTSGRRLYGRVGGNSPGRSGKGANESITFITTHDKPVSRG